MTTRDVYIGDFCIGSAGDLAEAMRRVHWFARKLYSGTVSPGTPPDEATHACLERLAAGFGVPAFQTSMGDHWHVRPDRFTWLPTTAKRAQA